MPNIFRWLPIIIVTTACNNYSPEYIQPRLGLAPWALGCFTVKPGPDFPKSEAGLLAPNGNFSFVRADSTPADTARWYAGYYKLYIYWPPNSSDKFRDAIRTSWAVDSSGSTVRWHYGDGYFGYTMEFTPHGRTWSGRVTNYGDVTPVKYVGSVTAERISCDTVMATGMAKPSENNKQ